MTKNILEDYSCRAFEEAPVVMALYDTSFSLIHANRAFRAAAGTGDQKLQGQPCHQIWGLETPCAGCAVQETLRTSQPASVELTAGNQEKWPSGMGAWHCQASPLFDETGALIGAISVSVNITRRLHAEEKLAQQARRQKAIIDILQHPAANLQEFLDYALNRAIELTESRIGYIYFYDEDTREFTLNTWSREVMKECTVVAPQTKYQLDKTGIWGEAVRQRRPIRINDFEASNDLKKGTPDGHVKLISFLTVPVIVRDRILAVVGVANKPDDYTELDELELTLLMDAVWKSVETLRSREALVRSAEQYRNLVEGLPDIVMRFDRQGRHLFVSDNVVEISGLNAGEFAGFTHRELGFPEELCDFWEKAIDRVFLTGRPSETEFAVDAGPKERFFDWRLLPELEAGGQVLSVLTIAREMTAQRKSERDYRELFQEMLDGFAMHELLSDAEGRPIDYRFLAVNPAFERLTRLAAEQVVGRTVREVLPGVEPHWLEVYGQVVRTGDPAFFENFSTELKRHFEVKAFRNAPGQFVTIFSDVTERRQNQQEREKLREQLAQSQKMESIGRLAGGVAHDFNNMLNIILSNTEMALEDVPLFSTLHESLSQVQKAARRSAALTAQLLAFARKQPVTPRPLELNAQVEGMLKMLRRLIGEEIQLDWRPGPVPAHIRMDPSQLDQVLANLCVNARDAIDGAGRITLETEILEISQTDCSETADAVPGNYAMLRVSDTGQGMDAETLSRLFEPFYTTKSLGKGTGLGLATVHGIVSQNNGFICVRSEVGKGTTFRIFLPQQVIPAAAPPASPPPEDVFGSETILLVEDEPEILHVARRILERHGYRVLIAATPAEALQQADAHPTKIHLLVSDVIMPEMNGRDLSRLLLARIPGLKCLFMSGYTADHIARHGVLDEGVHFIQKPFSKKAFTAMVREVLDAR